MYSTRSPYRFVVLALSLLFFNFQSSKAQDQLPGERLCDARYENCRTPLLTLIQQETVGIDVAWWFMEDKRYATEIVKRWQAGVPVRILIDPRANESYPTNTQMLQMVKDAGIPMRYRTATGILHWKMMLFDGQGKVEFSSANFSPHAFNPQVAYADYVDEVIYFTPDPSVVNSFRKKFDDWWINTSSYKNYANIATGTTLARRYPALASYAIDPALNFPPSPGFAGRAITAYRKESQGIDVIMYRITDERHANEMIAAVGRGVPVRLIHELGESYRNTAYPWDSYHVERMYMAGVQIKLNNHLGVLHEKATILHSQKMAIHASSNWSTGSDDSQQEHNYFTTKPWFYNWYVNHFNQKWNNLKADGTPTGMAAEFVDFVPQPPERPVQSLPANGALGQAVGGAPVQLKWEGGYWAHKYDIYLGTDANALPLVAADVQFAGVKPGPATAETYTVTNLQPGTKYFWKVTGKTMADIRRTSYVWSFTTDGATVVTPSGPADLTAAAASINQVDLSWTDTSNNEDGFKIEQSTDGVNFTEVATVAANVAQYSRNGLTPAVTYYYRVRAYNLAGDSPYSNTTSATTLPIEVVLFSDNFNDNNIDTSLWRVNKLEIAAANPAVSVSEQNTRVQVAPLINATGSHSNGYSTQSRYNLTNQKASVEVVQAANTSSMANTCFVLINGANWYRFLIEGSKLYFQQSVGGTTTVTSATYNATNQRYWRIRHDAPTDTVFWETSPDSLNWNVQRSASRQFTITGLRLEMYVRTWRPESAPGMARFDNVRIASN